MNKAKSSVISILIISFCFITGCTTSPTQAVTPDVSEKSASPTTPYAHHHGKKLHHIQKQEAQQN